MRPDVLGATAAAVILLAARLPAISSIPQAGPRAATLDAFVISRQGEFLSGLTSSDFRVVTGDGKQIPITAARLVSIPLANRGKATAAASMPLEASNRHTRDARLFVVIYDLLFHQSARRTARDFLDELVSMKADEDHVALFVAGRPELELPPTADPEVLARAFDRLGDARIALDALGLSVFVDDELPRIYQSLMATRWAQRSIVLLSPGAVHPAAMQNYRSWEAWSLRANAPMHGVDSSGAMPIEPGFVGGEHPLLRLATQETRGLLFINQSSLRGIAPKILAASSVFYQVDVELPEGVPTDQSFFMSVRTHPTAIVRARRRVRVPIPDPVAARATDELRAALDAPLPMDEIPIGFSVAATAGATSATIRFIGDPDRPAGAGVVELPAMPITVAYAAILSNGRRQMIATRVLHERDLRVEGCCATVRDDLTIPTNAIALRAAVYQPATGRTGSVFLTIERK